MGSVTRLYLGFGAIIIAAMVTSYLHLAAWLEPWMPPGWRAMSYVAALSIDGLIVAPIMARQIVGGPVPGIALPLAQWLGVVASIYVNASWGRTNVAGASWADVGVGAAILPVFALVAEHAMRATLVAHQAKEARRATVPARQVAPPAPVRRAITAPSPAAVAPPALERPTPSAPAAIQAPRQRPAWAELVARYGDSPRAIAEGTGTPLRTVQRWRQQAAT